MRKVILSAIYTTIFAVTALSASIVETHWLATGEEIYENGFMSMCMRNPAGGVGLFNMELIENDAAGSGLSEKGVSEDIVWGKNQARKILNVEDSRAEKAWIVIFTNTENPKHPLTFNVNGFEGQIVKTNREVYRWVEFPVSYLKKGRNVIELSCPEAISEEDGWSLYLARADEYEDGGGDPKNAGETSFKSTDGGKRWKKSPFGQDEKTKAEYSVRLSLDRYVQSGWLATPVVDLWRGEDTNFILTQKGVKKLRIHVGGKTPEGTEIVYFMRAGLEASPMGEGWSEYEEIGTGSELNLDLDGEKINHRYIQLRMELKTANPLHTPLVQSIRIDAELSENYKLPQNIHVLECDNPPIRYSSIRWEWEPWDRPEFEEVKERESLDEVIAGSRTEFDAQVKLLDHATKRWDNTDPLPEYPGWDALSILNRIERVGTGGMCIQLNNLLGGFCIAYGWQARHVNIVSHEVCEVWNDDYGKWIYIDASSVNHYNYDLETCEPLSLLELHQRFLDANFPDRPIDWMNDSLHVRTPEGDYGIGQGSLTHHMYPWSGASLAAHLRIVPRNNWYEKPYPRPLTHGKTWWPWDGYINWYDERTPPKRQYSWHTDRPRDMWPDLNKVHVDAVSGYGNDRLFLRFETYTPNFSHFEVNVDEQGWKTVGDRWAWILQSGLNTLKVRAVSMLDVKGKPSIIRLNHANASMK